MAMANSGFSLLTPMIAPMTKTIPGSTKLLKDIIATTKANSRSFEQICEPEVQPLGHGPCEGSGFSVTRDICIEPEAATSMPFIVRKPSQCAGSK